MKTAAVLVMTCALLAACRRAPDMRSPAPAVQGAPSTDVYLYRFARLGMGSGVSNLSNRRGYDNQPSWDGNSRVLYTTQLNGQTDIYEIDFEAANIRQVTTTPESEYSAAPSPDGRSFTVVRVEADSTQRLWRFPNDGSAPSVVLPEIKPVGYFAWLDMSRLALFVLGSPATLQIADTRTGQARIAARNIGRSLQRVPGGSRASFLHREGTAWVLKTIDPTPRRDSTFDIQRIAVMPDSADYVAWRSPTEVYTAAGSLILRLRLPETSWTVVDDLAGKGIRRITRIALSPDGSRLALVADEPTPNP
jgi:dipeptidyl aminopeptidase/acylaminoacyl peptidase